MQSPNHRPAANLHSQRSAIQLQVVVSYAVGGSTSNSVNSVLANALRYTSGPLIVHVSIGAPTWSSGYNQSIHHPRMHVNPTRLRVEKHTPAILAAHLSNWQFCERRAELCGGQAAGRFVLMSSNSVLIRPGLESFVRQHVASNSQSVGIVTVNSSAANITSAEAWECLHDAEWEPAWASRQAWRRPLTSTSALRSPAYERWGRPVWSLLARAPPAGWASSPLSMGRHEGSFYSFQLMRAFLRAFEGSQFARAAQLQQDGWPADGVARKDGMAPAGVAPAGVAAATRCECYCFLFAGTECAFEPWASRSSMGRASAARCLGGCTFEELLLPTFAAQQLPAAQWARAPPPAVLHLEGAELNEWERDGRRHLLAELPPLIGARPFLAHVFGVKVPKHAFPQVERHLWRRASPATGERMRAVRPIRSHASNTSMAPMRTTPGAGRRVRADARPDPLSTLTSHDTRDEQRYRPR